jgi:hypothetical protein
MRLNAPGFEQRFGGQFTGGAHNAASGVYTRTAHPKIVQRGSVAGPTGQRSQKSQLLKAQLTLKYVALGQTDILLKIPGRNNLTVQN